MPEQKSPDAVGACSLPWKLPMPCFHPRKMYATPGGGRWTCDVAEAAPGAEAVPVACGGCRGCLLRRSGEWVQRCLWELDDPRHEGVACFITLTFDDAHLPSNYSVSVEDIQDFMRALRQAVRRRRVAGLDPAKYVTKVDKETGEVTQVMTAGIRFYAVGEYGEKEDATKRPHYHFILFGWSPHDAEPVENSQTGLPQWSSEFLDGIWKKGRVRIGEVTKESIAYVTGYVFDKRWGDAGKVEYGSRPHPVTGEVCSVRPPFNHMSRMPGIGGGWYERFKDNDALSDFVVRNETKAVKSSGLNPAPVDPFRPRVTGRKAVKIGMPRYVIRQRLKGMSEAEEVAFKAERRAKAAALAAEKAADNTPARLHARHAAKLLGAASLTRSGGDAVEINATVSALCDAAGRLAEAERDGSAQRARDEQARVDRVRIMSRKGVGEAPGSAARKARLHARMDRLNDLAKEGVG